jgi:hypothetical protein
VGVARGSSVTFRWRVENDGTAVDQVTLRASAGSVTGFWVKFSVGTSDVTGMIVAGTYRRSLAPGASFTVTFRITVGANVQIGRVRSDLLTVVSQDPGRLDAVGTSIVVS